MRFLNWKHADIAPVGAYIRPLNEMKRCLYRDSERDRKRPESGESQPIPQQDLRFRLSIVAQAFVDLQQARHRADYDIEEPFQPLDAAVDVAQAQAGLSNLGRSQR